MAQLTQHATQLVRELLLQPGIPPYSEEAIRLSLSQVEDHHRQMSELLALASRRQREEEGEAERQRQRRARRRRPRQQQEEDEPEGGAGPRQQQEEQPTRRDQQQQQQDGQEEAPDETAAAAAAARGDGGGGGGDGDPADAAPSASQQQGAAPPDWQRHPELAGAVLIHHEAIMRLKRVLLTYCKVRSDRLVALWWAGRRLPEAAARNLSPSERQFFREHDAAMRRYMGHGPGGLREDLTLDAHPPRDAVLAVRVLRDHGAVRTAASSSVPLVRGSVHCLAPGEAEPLIRLGVLEALD